MQPDQLASPPGDISVTVSNQDSDAAGTNELVMAWARDRATGALRYILELGPDQRGARSGCECISCGLPLTSVNAAKAIFRRRPHFRHPVGAVKDSCLVLTAREAIRQTLQPGDFLILPRRRRSANVEGLSGELYEAWVDRPPEQVKISSVEFKDGLRALLVLDDGRQLEVQLVGSADASETAPTGITPRILIVVDDPTIAGMAPDELRHRLIPLLDEATWCGHWQDAALDEEAEAAALGAAEDALDWDSEDGELNADQRRESLLHREVKAILERTRRLRLPGWTVSDGRIGITRQVTTPPSTAILRGATLERRLGRVIPDVVAELEAGDELLVEVTVTNHVTDERLARIRDVNLPTLEIDISRMGGRITRAQLGLLVIEELAGKTWLHHPAMEKQRAILTAQVSEVLRKQKMREFEHREFMSAPVEEWAEKYLEAIAKYATLRHEDAPPDNGEHEHYLTEALEAVEEAARALKAHGYQEAMDNRLFSGGRTILERILSIKLDRGVGYKHDTGWQVINAILQDISIASKAWHSLYLIAVKVYRPNLTAAQRQRIDQWRAEVRSSIDAGEETYMRDPRYDRFLALLFPETREALASPYGRQPTEERSTSRRQEIAEKARDSQAAWVSFVRASSINPGNDYFNGANEQRWMWSTPGAERVEIAKVERDRLVQAGHGGDARTIVDQLTGSARYSGDPWSFALSLQHYYGQGKASTLRYLYSLGVITPLPAP